MLVSIVIPARNEAEDIGRTLDACLADDYGPKGIILPWHFREEFRLREKACLLSCGKFIVPTPHFTMV